MQTGVLREYSWSWAKEQSEADITQELKSNPHEILQRLAHDALHVPSTEQSLQTSYKILASLTQVAVDEERLNKFLTILKECKLVSTSSSKTGALLNQALSQKNIVFANSLIKILGKPEKTVIAPFFLAREAIEKGNVESALFILKNRFIKNSMQLKSLFIEACENNLPAVAEFIMMKITGFEISNETLDTLIRDTIRRGNTGLAILLLSKFSFPFHPEMKEKSNLLGFAACLKPENGIFLSAVLKKYKEHPDFNPTLFTEVIEKASKKAAIYANSNHLAILINHGAPVDPKIIINLLFGREDEYAITLLEKYPQHEYLDILMTAIKVGADFVVECILRKFEDKLLKQLPVAREDLYLALLERAFHDRNALAARFCIDRLGGKLQQQMIDRMIAEALSNNSEGLLILIVEKGFVPSSEFPKLLQNAIKEEQTELSRMLIALHTDVNYTDNNGITALMIAAARNARIITEMLIKNNAKVNAQDNHGNAPLHYASYVGSDEVIKLLLSAGAAINMQNKAKYTPLHIAAEEGWDLSARLFLMNDASKTIQNEAGNTPLHLMIKAEFPLTQCISYLVNKGSELHVQNNRGETPFGLLIERNMLTPIRFCFFPFRKLLENDDLIRGINNATQENVDVLCSKDNLSYAIPLEIPFLLNNYSLAHLITSRYKPDEFAKEVKKLTLRYPACSHQMIKDSFYKVMTGHLKEGLVEFEPKFFIEKKVTVEKMEKIKNHLLDLFDLINFEDSKKPCYRNPEKLSNDGYPVDKAEIRKGLQHLFTRIQGRTLYVGTPPAGELLIPWYERLEQMLLPLCEVIAFNTDKDAQASSIIELGIAGMHCGGRWVGTVRQLMQLEMHGQLPFNLEEYIKNALQITRRGIIESLVDEGNVHQFNHVLYIAGEDLGLIKPGTKEAYRDLLAETEVNNREKIFAQFHKLYNPGLIINLVRDKLAEFGRNGDNRDIVIDWFKENLPDYWKKEEYEQLIAKAKNEMEKIEIRQERLFTYLGENLWDENFKFKVSRRAAVDFLINLGVLGKAE